MGKALPERGSFFFVLLEQVPEAERGLPVDLVVGGFPGVPYPPHALPPVPGDEGLLRLPLPLAHGSRLEGAFEAGLAHAELHWSGYSHPSLPICAKTKYPSVAGTSSITFPCALISGPISVGKLCS